jgi:hypothetical protein
LALGVAPMQSYGGSGCNRERRSSRGLFRLVLSGLFLLVALTRGQIL